MAFAGPAGTGTRDPAAAGGTGATAGAIAGAGSAGAGSAGAGSAGGRPEVAAPSIALPVGGGAVRGIGEKFTVDAFTGHGTMRVPIELPAGRAGFGPQLALGYSSGSGNGPFGFGWRVAVPAVSRGTDKGLPRYRDDDVLLFAGGEELVPALVPDSGGGWAIDEDERDGHRVRRYRPRVEGGFARIERWTRLIDGDVHWRSLSRENVLTVYGADPGTRIADPADPRRVFSWLISASYDDRGNAIAYGYAAEDGANVPATDCSERHRVRGANRYLKRVRYGNRVPLLVDAEVDGLRRPHLPAPDLAVAEWLFEVVFDYGEGHYAADPPDPHGQVLVTAQPQAGGAWPIRADAFSSYRAGFEVRTHRLCRGVLVFHRFPDELGTPSYLTRSLRLHYDEKPWGAFLRRIVSSGYRRRDDGRYLERSLPALDCDYSPTPLEDPDYDGYQVRELDAASAGNLPSGVDDGAYRWVDLGGEGIAGVLTEQGGAWFYKPNLGHGRLGPVHQVDPAPAPVAAGSARSGATQLVDVTGDGPPSLVEFGPVPGFYGPGEQAGKRRWAPRRAFRQWPNLVWTDANVRLTDLTGDGLADVFVTGDSCLTWYSSLGADGFGPAERVSFPVDEERGPRVVFADASQSIHLADLSGDGLSDVVRIRNGEVCYWPNLGYGRFGAKVTMRNPPRFDRPERFDQRRLRLADTDGSGTTDLVYLGSDGVRIYLNESGNGWSAPRTLVTPGPGDNHRLLSVVDLLGRGTACLVWSSAQPDDARRPVLYLDLMAGRKPHLLTGVRDGLGAEVAIEYASSTEFYLADKAVGRSWATRLPFPVHVVRRQITTDHVGRTRLVSRFSYHHGHFDGVEREFRGFGRVDQLDAEDFGVLTETDTLAPAPGPDEEPVSRVPPRLVRTWFHTGAYLGSEWVSRHLASEYHREPNLDAAQVEAMLLADTVLPPGLTGEQSREACRALAGAVLRQEVYARDSSPAQAQPYAVTEHNYTVRPLQPRVFLRHPRETLNLLYERRLYQVAGVSRADPRASHTLTLDVDDYGNVLLAASVTYGRRFVDPDPRLTTADRDEQSRTRATVERRTVSHPVTGAHVWRIPQPVETRRYELHNAVVSAAVPEVTNRFGFAELMGLLAIAGDGAHDLPYEDADAAGVVGPDPFQRLIGRERTVYRRNDLTGALPLGQVESLALPDVVYRLALTPGQANQLFVATGKRTAPELDADLTGSGGYAHPHGDPGWWVPTVRVFYSADPNHTPAEELAEAVAHFFTARRYVDAFGHRTTVTYDGHDLLTVQTQDPLDNRVTAGERDAAGNLVTPGNDYRLLRPAIVMDANRNRRVVAYDTLGRVAGLAVMGKPEESLGDSLEGFVADLPDATVLAHLADPGATATTLLQRATQRFVYDPDAFARTGTDPAAVSVLARQAHDADPGGGTSRIQCRLSYADGLGQEIQSKQRAEPGPVVDGGPTVSLRWVGSGWVVRNNKGKPVRQHEPFFDDTPAFRFGHAVGVGSVRCYDPLDRIVAMLHPDHTWEKVVVDPWRTDTWDGGDTVLIADPATDPDVGAFFARLPGTEYAPTWHQARAGGALGAAEQDAATKAAVHAGTPTLALGNGSGRSFCTVTHNRRQVGGGPVTESFERLRFVLDVDGRQRDVVDALDRTASRHTYDLLGNRLHETNMEAGERHTLVDGAGQPVRRWDGRGHAFTFGYDALRRPTTRHVRGSDVLRSDPRTLDRDVLFERTTYGEGQPNDAARNLRTRVVSTSDGAGVDRTDLYDFKGNALHYTRQCTAAYTELPDWSTPVPLEPETWHNHATFDALNRVVTFTSPDGSVTEVGYDAAGRLTSVAVRLRGDGSATSFVNSVEYNARGQQTRVAHGNGAVSTYEYDPRTFRPARVATTRPSVGDAVAAQLFVTATAVRDLRHTFDPTGNLTRLADEALRPVFHQNAQVTPVRTFTYDATGRLVEATGREHAQQAGFDRTPAGGNYRDFPFAGATVADLQAMRTYAERYDHDGVGNLRQVRHAIAGGGWTLGYEYAEASLVEPGRVSNRLTRTTSQPDGAGPVTDPYTYDAHGCVTSLPHLPLLEWDFKGQLRASSRQVAGEGAAETTYYVYAAGGERVRKVTERASGTRRYERLYLRGSERYREFLGDGTTVLFARETLQVMAAKTRVAIVETTTVEFGQTLDAPAGAPRYQFTDNLGSTMLELDGAAGLISYEEFTPYGVSAFQAGRSAAEVSLKRYRYTGRERDEETGFTYHGARYCAPWWGRWVSCDPAGLVDGPNLYQYARSNPCRMADPTGTQSDDENRRVPDPVADRSDDAAQSDATGSPSPGEGSAAGTRTRESDVDPSGGRRVENQPEEGQPGAPRAAVAARPEPEPPAKAEGEKTPAAGKPNAAGKDKGWLYGHLKIDYEHWKSRNALSFFLAGSFIAIALIFIIPTARFSKRDPAWFRSFKIYFTAAAVSFAVYRALNDFGTEKGSKAAAEGDAKPLDWWSVVHWSAGAVLGLWQVPFPIMAASTVLWEGVEMSVPGFGDQEINWNRINDVALAWGAWLSFAAFAAYFTDKRVPWGDRSSDYERDRAWGALKPILAFGGV